MNKYLILIFLLSSVLSVNLISYIRQIGHKYNLLLEPRDDRWHSKPVAIHGGIGFYLVFLLMVLFSVAIFSPDIEDLGTFQDPSKSKDIYTNLTFLIALLGSSLLLFIMGFVDDLIQIRPLIKCVIQLIIIITFIIDIGTFHFFNNDLLNFLLTVFWFFGITNAVNLTDCFDGLCSTNVLIISIFMILISQLINTSDELFYLTNILVILCGALIGFIIHNFPPAKIFMGDSGSLSLGFLIAALTLPTEINQFYGYVDKYAIGTTLIPICLLAYPIFDTSLVTFNRILHKKNFYQGGNDHSPHRLSLIGFTPKQSLYGCLLISIIGGISAVLIKYFSDLSLLIFGCLILLCSILIIILSRKTNRHIY